MANSNGLNGLSNLLPSFFNFNNNFSDFFSLASQINRQQQSQLQPSQSQQHNHEDPIEAIASQSDTSQGSAEPLQIVNSSSASPASALNISTEVKIVN